MGYIIGDHDFTTHVVTAAIVAASFVNVADLNWIMFTLFKTRRSLYFWSFFASTWGVFFHQLGFLFRDFQIVTNAAVYSAIISLGWIAMVTGQSLVLYSRLHLLVHNQTTLRLILAMIIGNALICHVPIITLVFGSYFSSNPGAWASVYEVYEKLQITLFFLQEVIISGVYVWAALKIFPLQNRIHGQKAANMRRHLVLVNLFIIALDIVVLAIGYAGLFDVQTVTKALLYSVKLKIEFTILNSLRALAKGPRSMAVDYPDYELSGGSRCGTHPNTAAAKDMIHDGSANPHQWTDTRPGYSAYAKAVPAGSQKDASDGIVVAKTTEITHELEARKNADGVGADSSGLSSLDTVVPLPCPSITSQTSLTRLHHM